MPVGESPQELRGKSIVLSQDELFQAVMEWVQKHRPGIITTSKAWCDFSSTPGEITARYSEYLEA